jgi:hypothetical protein
MRTVSNAGSDEFGPATGAGRESSPMAIQITSVDPNRTIPDSPSQPGLHIFSGVVECVFKGDNPGPDGITRDTLSFTVGRVNIPGITEAPDASCVVSLASIAFDGYVNDALWAVDRTEVTEFINIDRGSGTADLQVVAHLAVRGASGIILRVNYVLFYPM